MAGVRLQGGDKGEAIEPALGYRILTPIYDVLIRASASIRSALGRASSAARPGSPEVSQLARPASESPSRW